ncbi:MAG: putative DNA binding domain-containing protein [Oscillospiraceae bacterium]|nr:putative DNA binding domain-containing protein [Oscillospiraceae bacterium]
MNKYEESFAVELKREVSQNIKKGVIAFANTDGGTIYVGVDNSGDPTGVTSPDETMTQIGNMIRDGIKPDLTAYTSIDLIEDEGVKIVRVSILRGAKRPYHLTEKGLKPGGVFVRHGVSSVPATDEAIRQMLRESGGVAFDKSRCLNQELTFEYVGRYFADNGISFTESNKRTLKLVDFDGYYTNAALLFSDQCEHSVKCAVYDGTGKGKFKARKEFFGSVLRQMDESYDYINLSNNQNSTFDGLMRIDHPDYPPAALREALLNMIIHRDYDYSGSSIVNIYDDRIEFISLGGLVKGITVADIMNGISQPRNTVVADIFYRLRLIESYGTGIQKIMESYEGGVRPPKIQTAPASFVITLPNMTEKKPGNTAKPAADIFTSREQREIILKLIADKGAITRRDVENALPVAKAAAVRLLNQLLSDGLIKRTGKAKAIRYTLS